MDFLMNENYKMNITVRITELVLISKITWPVPEIIQKKFNQINEVDLRDSKFFEMISETGGVDLVIKTAAVNQIILEFSYIHLLENPF